MEAINDVGALVTKIMDMMAEKKAEEDIEALLGDLAQKHKKENGGKGPTEDDLKVSHESTPFSVIAPPPPRILSSVIAPPPPRIHPPLSLRRPY